MKFFTVALLASFAHLSFTQNQLIDDNSLQQIKNTVEPSKFDIIQLFYKLIKK